MFVIQMDEIVEIRRGTNSDVVEIDYEASRLVLKMKPTRAGKLYLEIKKTESVGGHNYADAN